MNIPFLNLCYIKSAFDYLIGYSMMETLSSGVLKRVEKRMKRDYNQEFLFTKPSTLFKGLNYGVDFKGGTLIELRVQDSSINISDIRINVFYSFIVLFRR